MKNLGNILWGIALVIIGLIIGGNALGITDINIFFDGWWTLIIIIPCFICLFTKKEKVASFVGLLIGIILLLCCQDVLSFILVLKLAIPVSLIIIGVSLIVKNVLSNDSNEETKN